VTPYPGICPEGPDSFLKNPRLGGDPVVSGLEAKEFKNQEGPKGQSDMGALRLALPALATLHMRYLLQAPVVLLDLPTRLASFKWPSSSISRSLVAQCSAVPPLEMTRSTFTIP